MVFSQSLVKRCPCPIGLFNGIWQGLEGRTFDDYAWSRSVSCFSPMDQRSSTYIDTIQARVRHDEFDKVSHKARCYLHFCSCSTSTVHRITFQSLSTVPCMLMMFPCGRHIGARSLRQETSSRQSTLFRSGTGRRWFWTSRKVRLPFSPLIRVKPTGSQPFGWIVRQCHLMAHLVC